MDKLLVVYPSATDSNIIALSNAFFIVFIPFGPAAVWMQTKYGVKNSLVFGLGLQMIGAWIKVCAINHYSALVFGTAIIAIGQPFIVNTASIVSANWFPQADRVVSTMISVNSYLFGQSCGFLLPMAFIHGDTKDYRKGSTKDISVMKEQIYNMILFLAIFSTVLQVAMMALFESHP